MKLLDKCISLLKNIDFEKVNEMSKKYGDYVSKAYEIYESVNKKKKEGRKKGQSGNQFFNSELSKDNSINSEFDLKEIISSHLYEISKMLSVHLGWDEEELANSFKDYKKYLDDEELSDEELKMIVEKFQMLISRVLPIEKLESKLGNNLFKELTSLVILHGMELSKAYYQFSKRIINKIELKEKVITLYQNYIVGVMKFIKENNLVKEVAVDVFTFATGNRVAAIVSVINKVTSAIFNKFNNDSERYNEGVKVTEKEFEDNAKKNNYNNKNNIENKLKEEKWYDE